MLIDFRLNVNFPDGVRIHRFLLFYAQMSSVTGDGLSNSIGELISVSELIILNSFSCVTQVSRNRVYDILGDHIIRFHKFLLKGSTIFLSV